MNKALESLASISLAILLLVLLLLGLATGTIVESMRGAEVAGRVVYYSWWFIGLQGAFVLNVLASIALHFPWGKERVGFLTAHSSLVVILIGALVSFFWKTEGHLMLWEGESGNEIVNQDPQGRVLDRATLPFTVKLDRFRVDHYPGTMRPSNFRSDVEISDPAGQPFKAGVWMNHELEHRGWRLFQSSYQQANGRSATVLSVAKDPGQPIVFVGYVLLVLGMCIVLGTRIAQTRALAAGTGAGPGRPAAKGRSGGKAAASALALLFAGGLGAWGGNARAADDAVSAARRLPVQHDGRVMPLDTVAREAVWNVTGARAGRGDEAVAQVLRWLGSPDQAVNDPIVKLGSDELAVAAGLPASATHASFSQLVNSRAVIQLMGSARQAAASGTPRTGVMAAAEKVEERLLWMQRFLEREILRSIPIPGDPNAQWTSIPFTTAGEIAQLAGNERLDGWPSRAAIEREITYNDVRPTRLAWIVLALALALSIAGWNRGSKLLDGLSLAGLVAGFAIMSWGIWARWDVAGRVPASNMYESLLFLAWGVGLFAVVAFALVRNRLVVVNANAMAALTMILTDLLPIDAFVHPVPPVLAGTYWLAIHVPIIMVSYSVLALGVVVAHMQIGTTIFAPKRSDLVARMADLLYWYIHVGSILLITGILTGSMWASSSWGRYWGWDPKEVWSLVAFLAYIAILHGRWERFIGAFGVAALSIGAFQTILMTYLGVNFVLTTGLHSYGMGDSPVVKWMALVAGLETVFLLWGIVAHRQQLRHEEELALL